MGVVVADAGPLIGLARIQQLQLLRHLFTTIWITEVIAAEIGLTPGFAGPH
jgi:predicted nucleic acid-binding protein